MFLGTHKKYDLYYDMLHWSIAAAAAAAVAAAAAAVEVVPEAISRAQISNLGD